MSLNAMNVVWLYYPSGGPMLVLALALADEADDYGGGISASLPHLAKKTRQTERGVQSQIAKFLNSALVERLRPGGGRGQPAEYRMNLGVLLNPDSRATLAAFLGAKKDEHGSTDLDQKGRTPFYPSDAERMNAVHPFPDDHIKEVKELPHASSPDVAAFILSVGPVPDDDRRLAQWIFGLLRKLNPKHREPSWATWCRDIRRMREQDRRTRKEIALLFAWANADPFWQANVLSPATLRRQWERLEMQRLRNGGGVHAPRQGDGRCCWDKGGTKCEEEGVFGHPDGTRYCRKHEEEQERERASA